MMLVSPSIISSKLEVLGTQIKECDKAGAYSYHLDVMDGHFVPNLTMGPDLVSAVRRCTEERLEAHLMIERPDKYAEKFIKSGSDLLFIHSEVLVDIRSTIKTIRDNGALFGIALNPETPVDRVLKWIEESDTVLIMSVHPGFSGQSFIRDTLPKIREVRKFIDNNNLQTKIEVDGGINAETGKLSAEAGADVLVSASYIFSGNIGERIGALSSIMRP
ncbi:MAG: ribulose-phosphate 3-epimerase [Candidatus Thermoplasmatota archaeon]|nr:ribulose-phosphate 3-epimerase [Candidatus Thermoplasmatota archaeon]